MNTISPPKSMLNRNFLLLCANTAFATMPGLVLNSLMSSFAQERLGVSLSLAGVLVSLNSITSLVLHPLIGPISNRIDKRLLIMLSAVLSTVSCLGFCLFPQYIPALVFRVIAGFSWALSAATGLIFVSESLPPEKATNGIAYYGMIQIAVTALGPTLALAAIERTGYSGMFLLMTACSVAALICSYYLLPSGAATTEKLSLRSVHFNEIFAPEALLLACIGGLFAFNNGVQSSYVLPYADACGFGNAVGLYFILQAAATLFTRLLLARFLYKKSFFFVSTFTTVLLLIFAVFMAIGTRPAHIYIGGILMGLGYGCIIPAVQAACIRFTPPERGGSAASTYMFAINIGIGGGGLLGGVLAEHFGYSVLFLSLIVPTTAAWLLSLYKGRFPAS